ncbi:MAG: phage tail assembly chaperone [Alphaproteobacteria bacterium]|nr:phage tail assembly chaperone [Alphaproteobacteria bacterium]
MTARFADVARRAARAAALVLGWRPADFWAATPAELLTCLGQDAADAPADAGLLARMMEQFPDAERSRG